MGIRGFLVWLIALFLCTTLCSASNRTPGGGYKLASVLHFADGRGLVAHLLAVGQNLEEYGPDVEELLLTVRSETNDRLHVHITDISRTRWEIPQSVIPREANLSHHPTLPWSYHPDQVAYTFGSNLEFLYTSDPFGFAVTRPSTGEVLFNSTPSYSTDGSPLFNNMVFKDQYLEISTQLEKNSALFGFGESTRPEGLRLVEGKTYTLWATDIGSNIPDVDLYGAYPFYMEVKDSGAHGVLLLNSNGMDIVYAADHLTYRVIGGILDFYFVAGPSPLDVVDQYTQLAGRPAAMPYWTLGFHQCRWGYKNVEDLEGVVSGYAHANIPLEAMWSDIDHMDSFKDFTLDPVNYPEDKLRAFVDNLHGNDQKYVLIIDPGINVASNYTPFKRLVELDAYVKNQYGGPFLAQVWPGPVYFPDFLHPNISEVWGTEIKLFHQKIPFDGIWCDMNEASNFCTGPSCYLDPLATCPLPGDFTTCCLVCNSTPPLSPWDDPPYKINCSYGAMYAKTIALSAMHFGDVREYDAHNLYGLSEVIVTREALTNLTGKRPFILSRSTFVGSGAYAAHWTGDNQATWADLAYSIVSVLNSGIVGLPMVGADICGFQSDTWEELCNRWIQVGAFYPFARDHSDTAAIRQELYLWDSVAQNARKYLGVRYQLLPYYYTLLFEAHCTGAPLLRPLFFEFPDDPVALNINAQFLVGSSILVSPVLAGGETTVKAYFPQGAWFNLVDMDTKVDSVGEFHVLPAPLDTINIHLRQGSIIPLQDAALTTTAVRKTPFTLVVVFSRYDNATGKLFLDDGESLEMNAHADKGTLIEFSAFQIQSGTGALSASVSAGEFALKGKYVLQKVKILGFRRVISSVSINGVPLHRSLFHIHATQHFVDLSSLNLPLGNSFELSWECHGASSKPKEDVVSLRSLDIS
ncbi:unnamed protein product [Calypogeia fissa]